MQLKPIEPGLDGSEFPYYHSRCQILRLPACFTGREHSWKWESLRNRRRNRRKKQDDELHSSGDSPVQCDCSGSDRRPCVIANLDSHCVRLWVSEDRQRSRCGWNVASHGGRIAVPTDRKSVV